METSGSYGIVGLETRNGLITPYLNFRQQSDPVEVLRERYEKRQIIKQELRKQELEEKERNGELTKREAIELTGFKINNAIEKMSSLLMPKVCYMA